LPFLQQKLDTNKIKTVQPDYLIFKDFIINQKEFFRSMEVPRRFRWMVYTVNHPGVSLEHMLANSFPELDKANSTLKKGRNEKNIEVFKKNYSDNLVDNFSVKYITIPPRDMQYNRDIWEIFYGKNSRQLYINELDKLPYLKKIDIGTSELVVYENENYRPHIYSDSGLDYYQINASEFGGFEQNQNPYLNSGIEKRKYLLGNFDNVVVPIEADQNKIAEMMLAVDKMTEPAEKRKLQSKLDTYNNLFFKDFKLQIPAEATYKIYIKKDSVLVNNKNISVKIDSYVLEKDETGINKEGWSYFNQIELDKGEYSFKLYVGNVLIDAINSGDIVLSAENLAETIQAPQLEYKQINPTKYIVNVHQASQSFPLIFSESFHPGWKIYVQPELADEGTGKFVSDNNQGTIQNENLSNGHFYETWFKKPIDDNNHLMVNGYANFWWIDVEEVCGRSFDFAQDDTFCVKNSDGSYDFSVIIEFEPQKYFYLGLGISGITLLSCIGYLGWYFVRSRKRKEGGIVDGEN